VPSSQTILLHINDTAECTALEGKHTETCFVRPGRAAAAAKSPTASKTVAPALTRTYGWGITKAVNTAQIDTASSAPFNYTVSVTHDAGTDSGWKASGEISVSNPNSAAITGVKVTDAINDANATCTVTGGASATLPAESTTKFAYSCSYSAQPAASSQTNTATIAWSAQELSNASKLAEGSTTATAPIDWSKATLTVRDGSVTVSDSIAGSLGTVSSTSASPTVFEYSHTFSGDPAGTCTSHENTASFTTSTTSTKGSSSKTVKVCVGADPTVSKTAAASFGRTYTWGITKTAAKPEIDNGVAAATFNYSVSVTHDSGTDVGWTVSGAIKVANPNDWESIALTGVSDAIDNGGSCSITSGNPTAIVPAGSSTELGYTCTYGSAPSPNSFTNTATAGWDMTAASTPDASASGQASGAFGTTPTVTNGSVTVSDSIAGSLGTVSYTDPSPKVFAYSHAFTGAKAGTCTSYPNTSTFTTNTSGAKGSASQTVVHCRWGAKYTMKCTGVTWAFSGFPNLPNNTINEKIKVDGVFVYLGTFVFNGSTGGNTVPLNLTPGEHSIAAWAGWKNMNGLTGEADKPAVTVKCK
jgi:hypothetical protein